MQNKKESMYVFVLELLLNKLTMRYIISLFINSTWRIIERDEINQKYNEIKYSKKYTIIIKYYDN